MRQIIFDTKKAIDNFKTNSIYTVDGLINA